MEMMGTQRIAAPPPQVWVALNDPDVLRRCIAGCESLDRVSDTEFAARVFAKVGPVSTRVTGRVVLTDLDPPRGYTLSAEGTAGTIGHGRGGASVRLDADGDDSTVLSYTVNAEVGGRLAQVGSRLIDIYARKMADDFFSRFSRVVAPAPGDEPVDALEPVVVPGGAVAGQRHSVWRLSYVPWLAMLLAAALLAFIRLAGT
jgi:carbon monoxide dehydrogenase subunit G